MKVIIPIAGTGSRLKPHTHTVPKPLMEVAGKPIIKYVIDDILKLRPDEIIFVVGYKRKSIKDYIKKFYPKLKCSFVVQKVRNGDGSAIRLGLEDIEEDDDLFVIFGADTLIDFNIVKSIHSIHDADALVYTKKVMNPSHYGIANIQENKDIIAVEEKPENPKSNLAIIGAYYFKSALLVKSLLNEFYSQNITVKGEYKLIQVIERYIELKNVSVKAEVVEQWFDCGRVEVMLEANRYFLRKKSKGDLILRGDSIIIPPSFVSSQAKIEKSVIGPFASIGDEAELKNTIIEDSIISYKAKIENLILKKSMLGKEVSLNGKPNKINIGEKSQMTLE
jgi:glucose-1-phosphate thymidylyltransferase